MTPIIIGSHDDPHVRAVVVELGDDVAVLDAETLREVEFEYRPPDIRLRSHDWTVTAHPGVRGWVRRLSPMSWEAGTTIGSHDAVSKASWLSLLAALLRHPDVGWLSDIDAITAAENKLTPIIH